MAKFETGNRMAVGNRGGGRPRALLQELTTGDAPEIWAELKAIAFDHAHPLHPRHGFEALKTLATLAFPRLQAVAVQASVVDHETEPSLAILELARRASEAAAARQRESAERGVCPTCMGTKLGPKQPLNGAAAGH